MAVITLVPRSASQIIGVVPVDTRDGYGFSLGVGAFRVRALNSASTWYWSDTDGELPADMTQVDPGDEVSFTGPQTAIYCKGTEPITLQVTFDPPLAALPPDGGLFGAKTIVVSTGGNDAAGTASKYAAEFLTIAAALAAAASGDTIVIRPGSYAPAAQLTLKAGVGLHFMLGAQVTAPAGSVIFYDGGASIAARITGDGTFICTSVSFLFDLSNASVDFEAMDIPATTTAPLISFSGNGSLRARVKSAIVTHGDILNTGNSSPVVLISAPSIQANQRVVYIGGAGAANVTIEADQSITGGQILVDSGSAGATSVAITAPTITATVTGDYGITVNHAAAARYDINADAILCAVLNQASNAACALYLNGKTISARSDAGVSSILNAYGAGKTFVDCDGFDGVAASENPIAVADSAEVHVLRGRIRGLDGSANGSAISTIGPSNKLRLYPGAVLIAGSHASAKSISTNSTPTVLAMGAIAANKDADMGVTIAVGSLLVDAAVV